MFTTVPRCLQPRLKQFRGRPKDLTPKARFLSWFGWPRPFDRHDWTVDRCGTDVRYVIDYYSMDGAKKENGSHMPDTVRIDVRPAMDSLGDVWDRCRMAWRSLLT